MTHSRSYLIAALLAASAAVSCHGPESPDFVPCRLAEAALSDTSSFGYKAMASAEVEKDLISLQKETLTLQSDTLKITGDLYRSLSSIEGSVEINGIEMNKAELSLISEQKKDASKEVKKPQKEPYTRLVEGEFILSEITMSKETGNNLPKSIGFIDVNTGKQFKYSPDYDRLSELAINFLMSCIKGETVELKMTASYDGNDNLKSVYILSWNGQDLAEPTFF